VLTATRSPQLPDIPAVAEFVPGFEAATDWKSVEQRVPITWRMSG